tara:strand:+ start:108 stop:470 length:363 start_codon:yes stop_codon:yes gene_type:complete
MANEITITTKLSVSKGNLIHAENPGTGSFTLNGSVASGGVLTVATTAGLITMGSVTTAGYSFFRNTDTTNYVEVGTGTTTFTAFMKLAAGESAVLRLGTNAPSARANTLPLNLQYYILSD